MKINESKFKRQLSIIEKWWTVDASGVFIAITGFGKTFVILTIIKRMTDKFPHYRSTIIVPSTKLKDDWERQIESMNLPNVIVYVVNTYVNIPIGDPRLETELLAGDEVHHYCSEDAEFFNKAIPKTKYRYFIGASATLSKEEIDFLTSCGIKLFDEVSEREAEANRWIAPSIVYNLKLAFTEKDKKISEELNQQFRVNFARFDHKFDLMMACSGGNKQFKVKIDDIAIWKTGKEWRIWWAEAQGWNSDLSDDHDWSPESIIKYSIRGTRAMKERKELLYNIPSKVDKAIELIERFKDKRIVIFCETQKAADEIEARMPDRIKAYHSKLTSIVVDGKKIGPKKRRELIIQQFEDDKHPCHVIVCVKALDEGFNVEKIGVTGQHSYTSVKRRDVQRRGRGGRIDYEDLDKVSISVNFYMEGSQETKWLASKQKKAKKPIWITSIDEIDLGTKTATLL